MHENLQATNAALPECTQSVTEPSALQSELAAQAIASDKRFRRTLIATFLLLFVSVSVFVAQTYAYFTDTTTSQSNSITPGQIGTALINVSDGGSFDWSARPVNMMPATVYSFDGVGVKNTGTLPVYVRIKVEKNILQSENEMSPGWEEYIACNFMANDASLPEEQRDLWIYHEGYYYYKLALAPTEATTSLFDTVIFSPAMGNEFRNCSVQFKLICQTVQSGGNSPDPTTAWGWPDGQSSLN